MAQNINLTDAAMEQAVGGTGRSDIYDMYGFVVEKIPADQYENHYKVKGDNDEIFICWYSEDIILAPGTEVGMIHIEQDNGWKIEPIMHI